MIKKDNIRKNLKKKSLYTCIILFSFLFLYLIPSKLDKSLIATSTHKLLNGLGIYTEEIKQVEIESNNYNNPGSWHINKSAKWIGEGKAQITFDINTMIKREDRKKDIVLMIDNSSSMGGSKLKTAINDAKELVNYLLEDSNNRIAIITFGTESEIVTNLSNNKEEVITLLDSIVAIDNTNYYRAFLNLKTIMEEYQPEEGRDVVALFLTDGTPTEEDPNQTGTYEVLKDKFPYLSIQGIQYEMGTTINKEIKKVTDKQWIASQTNLKEIVFESALEPFAYKEFTLIDFIDTNYFKINSSNDIKVSKGNATLEQELGQEKVIWTFEDSPLITGRSATMTIDIELKDTYKNTIGYYPTNTKETIIYKLNNEDEKEVISTKTPILKNNFEITYDVNTPNGCSLEEIPIENYFVFEKVEKKTEELSCDGYLFKGWEFSSEDESTIKKVNDDVFLMPDKDITIRATWTKQAVYKSMEGSIHEKTTLYKVLENEANNATYARKYTGPHQDSIDESKSTENIYYWYASSADNAQTILNKNNVIFADQCWQMIRTTDTGGVKMMYNGEAVDNKCLSTRGEHIGYSARTTQKLSGTYYYGSSYKYNKDNKTFQLSGTITTGEIKTGQYTCKLTNDQGSCSTIYLVDEVSSSTTYYVFPIGSNANYTEIGKLQFNQQSSTLGAVGYKYNERYFPKSKTMVKSDNGFVISGNIGLSETYHYYYGDTVIKDGDYYYLQNNDGTTPSQIPWSTEDSENERLMGKFTCQSANSNSISYKGTSIPNGTRCSTVYYVIDVKTDENILLYQQMKNNNTIGNEDIILSQNIINNNDGTFTLDEENKISIKRKDWYDDFANYTKYYYCSDYTSSTCQESEMRYLIETVQAGNQIYIDIINNYKYAKGFDYENGTYKLNEEATTFWDISNSSNKTSLNNAHYTCFNKTGECSTIYYIYYLSNTTPFYIELTNGKSIEDAIYEMITKEDINEKDSTIKTAIDYWYKQYLNNYTDYIEETIFCNDRTVGDLGGWNPNGGSVTKYIGYAGSSRLSCIKENDKFSILNDKAKLTYSIGLMTNNEMRMQGNAAIRATNSMYWLMSPASYHSSSSLEYRINNVGTPNYSYHVYVSYGVRPAISLIPGIEFYDGDGSMEHPYMIETNK